MSASTDPSSPVTHQTKILMVMDVVESVRLMEQDENDFVARWQSLVGQAEHQLLPLHGGRMVKSLGDGLHALPTLEGYTLLLSAVALMHRNSASDFKRSREMLEHLVERSRRHPAPHAWLATWHVLLVQQGWSDNPEAQTRQAMDSTRRALENDPGSSLALTVQGFVLTNLKKDLAGAASSYEAALQINPNESLAWLLTGTLNAFMGNGADALDASERALLLSPLDPLRYFYDSLAASAAITAGKYDRAIELAKRSLKANRSHTSTYRALAIAQSLSDQMEDARDTVQRLLQLEPSFTVTQFLARTPARGAMASTVADALLRAGLPAWAARRRRAGRRALAGRSADAEPRRAGRSVHRRNPAVQAALASAASPQVTRQLFNASGKRKP